MKTITYTDATKLDTWEIGSDFATQHGDTPKGIIPDEEYDRLFDHLASVLRKFGSFSEEASEMADFNGYRYVDQIPWITIVPEIDDPSIAVSAALEAIATAHRPLAISFDFEEAELIILPPNKVITGFKEHEVTPKQ